MKTKMVRIVLDSYGSFLGAEKGCLVVKNRGGKVTKYPLSENLISEIELRSGNHVSVGALVTASYWGIDLTVSTSRGHPISLLRPLTDLSHVETRVNQFDIWKGHKSVAMAKGFVLAKLKGCNKVLRKYGEMPLDEFKHIQRIRAIEGKTAQDINARLTSAEGKFSDQYFMLMMGLFYESYRPEGRKTFKAFDGVNNLLNLAYTIMLWKVHLALVKAKLEPYLGFLHNVQVGPPALVCDFQELYRYMIDDFVIGYCRENVKLSDFVLRSEEYSKNKKMKRLYLRKDKELHFIRSVNDLFQKTVEVPRIRKGKRCTIETLVREECLLFASYIRGDKNSWVPRIADLPLIL